jgi:hypothetical protein
MHSTRSALVRFGVRVAGIALLTLAVVGCQRRGDVSGKVTYKDKPVVFGTVLIQGRDGLRQGNIAPDGSYTVRDVAAGEVRVAVSSPNPKGIQLYPNKNPNYPQDPYPDVPGWFPIPQQYEKVETSGLTYTIRGGTNTINIELK